MISSPFAVFNQYDFKPREKVYVVSDSMYADYQKAEALNQIQVLESRASEYRQALDSLTSTIDGLKKENGLLEPAEDTSK